MQPRPHVWTWPRLTPMCWLVALPPQLQCLVVVHLQCCGRMTCLHRHRPHPLPKCRRRRRHQFLRSGLRGVAEAALTEVPAGGPSRRLGSCGRRRRGGSRRRSPSRPGTTGAFASPPPRRLSPWPKLSPRPPQHRPRRPPLETCSSASLAGAQLRPPRAAKRRNGLCVAAGAALTAAPAGGPSRRLGSCGRRRRGGRPRRSPSRRWRRSSRGTTGASASECYAAGGWALLEIVGAAGRDPPDRGAFALGARLGGWPCARNACLKGTAASELN